MNNGTVTKTSKLEPRRLENIASLMRAIAHPVRIQILKYLESNESSRVTEIHKSLKLEQPVASHHLAILRRNDVLHANRDGKNVFYSLNEQRLDNILHCIELCKS